MMGMTASVSPLFVYAFRCCYFSMQSHAIEYVWCSVFGTDTDQPCEPLYSERLCGSTTLRVLPKSKDVIRGVCGFPEVWDKHV